MAAARTPAFAMKMIEAFIKRATKKGIDVSKVKKSIEAIGKKTGTKVKATRWFDDLYIEARPKGKMAAKKFVGGDHSMLKHSTFWSDIRRGYSVSKFPKSTKAIDYITAGGSKFDIQNALSAGFSKADLREIVQGLLFGRGTGRGLN